MSGLLVFIDIAGSLIGAAHTPCGSPLNEFILRFLRLDCVWLKSMPWCLRCAYSFDHVQQAFDAVQSRRSRCELFTSECVLNMFRICCWCRRCWLKMRPAFGWSFSNWYEISGLVIVCILLVLLTWNLCWFIRCLLEQVIWFRIFVVWFWLCLFGFLMNWTNTGVNGNDSYADLRMFIGTYNCDIAFYWIECFNSLFEILRISADWNILVWCPTEIVMCS